MSYIVHQRIGNRVYAYEVEAYWDKDKKSPRQRRRYLGRVDEHGNIIPKRLPRPRAALDHGDVAFALEGTIADDLPKKKDTSPTTRLGAGPAITIMDRSVIADRRLVELLVRTAEEEGIPYQFKQPLVGGTDAGRIHLTREGVPSAVVSVPCRYIHAPACLLSLTDFENTVRLMKGALARLTSQWVTKSTS